MRRFLLAKHRPVQARYSDAHWFQFKLSKQVSNPSDKQACKGSHPHVQQRRPAEWAKQLGQIGSALKSSPSNWCCSGSSCCGWGWFCCCFTYSCSCCCCCHCCCCHCFCCCCCYCWHSGRCLQYLLPVRLRLKHPPNAPSSLAVSLPLVLLLLLQLLLPFEVVAEVGVVAAVGEDGPAAAVEEARRTPGLAPGQLPRLALQQR
mmetsp:Transcript_98458/g.248562  ORF Transcript_98458/g.248562 Transcript_98458/m.248562 type:complete len:203 (-) Transcript_98458:1660-2268(-)